MEHSNVVILLIPGGTENFKLSVDPILEPIDYQSNDNNPLGAADNILGGPALQISFS